MTIAANNPALKSWVEVPENSDFPIQNLPFGTFKPDGKTPRAGVAIGSHVLDLAEMSRADMLADINVPAECFSSQDLNGLIKAAGKQGMRALRQRISDLLNADNPELRDSPLIRSSALLRQQDVELLLPVTVRDYTDFYASEQHAYNVGCMFRDPDNALMPNWKHLPVGYHGRASSIVVSGVPLHRPKGQRKPPDATAPIFGPSARLDFELEMGFLTFEGKPLGQSISVEEADDYIFGLVLLNDWSARDIQAWEYVPLGPFLGKNFGSSVSPWIVTLDALEPFRSASPEQDPPVLPYLQQPSQSHYDLALEVFIETPQGVETRVSESNLKHLYWSMRQQLAHHTVNGCNISAADMLASGTISGSDPSAYGSMLELSWAGSQPVSLNDGTQRTFIDDGDTVVMRGHGVSNGVRLGFGEVRCQILPVL